MSANGAGDAVAEKEQGEQVDAAQEEETYEQMFANRYTDDDPEYAKTKTLPDPPCMHPWYGRPKRVFDYPQPNRKPAYERRGDRRRSRSRSRGRSPNRTRSSNVPSDKPDRSNSREGASSSGSRKF